MTLFRLFGLLTLAALLSLLIGCSNANVPLGGTVTFSDDGRPLTTGIVLFKKGNEIAKGNLQQDGTFVLGFVSEKDGLPPGTYTVYIYGAEKVLIPAKTPEHNPVMESLIDLKFTNADTSGLTVDVTKSTKKFDFQVDRYVPKGKR